MPGKLLFPILLLITALFGFSNCRKVNDYVTPDAPALRFSTDTVKFDTVFTARGSATINFRMSNIFGSDILLDKIELAGGEASPFRINIDGVATTRYEKFELNKADSAYIFVEVTVDPDSRKLPFVVADSILFEYGGRKQYVILEAYGQNVHVIRNLEQVPCGSVWNADKPYLIDGVAIVPRGCDLDIMAGTRVYFHKNSLLLVAGTLRALGQPGNPILFSGDRLEQAYKKEPGQWFGIRFIPQSEGNILNACIIENAAVGIQVDSLPITPGATNLTMEQSIVRNMSNVGVLGYTATIHIKNCLVYNCAQACVAAEFGGNITLVHSTLANFTSTSTKKNPVLYLSNADYPVVDANGKIIGRIANPLAIRANQNIITGNLEDEVELSLSGKAAVDTSFRRNLIRAKNVKFGPDNLLNKSAGFVNISSGDFQLKAESDAVNAGYPLTGELATPRDITGKLRDNRPDVGCYER